jgi:hypothetical protein
MEGRCVSKKCPPPFPPSRFAACPITSALEMQSQSSNVSAAFFFIRVRAALAASMVSSKPPFERTREYDVRSDRHPESERADKWDKNENADDRSDRRNKGERKPNMKTHGTPTVACNQKPSADREVQRPR